MPQEFVKSNVRRKISVREIVLCGMFAAVTAVLSQISVPIGPVPISCSWIAVFLTGLLLPMRPAVLSQIVYLLLGTVGVPVALRAWRDLRAAICLHTRLWCSLSRQ